MTCGMTTAFAHAADGDLVSAVHVQPFAALMAIATATVVWGGGHVALTGSTLPTAVARAVSGRFLWVTGAAFLGAWGYKLLTWGG